MQNMPDFRGTGVPNLAQQILTQQALDKIKRKQNFLSNYNDPLEVNSLADAILTTFNPNMKRTDLGGLEKIPILNILTSTVVDVFYKGNIKPVLESKDLGQGLMTSGLNLFMNFGETMDIVANPIKGLIMEGEEGFRKGLGVSPDGRKNYDFDTGNVVADIALETLIDPLNYLTGGGKTIASKLFGNVTREQFTEAATEATLRAGKELLQGMDERIAKKVISKAFSDYLDPIIPTGRTLAERFFNKVVSNPKSLEQCLAESIDAFGVAANKGAFKNLLINNSAAALARTDLLNTLGTMAINNVSHTTLDSLRTMFKVGTNFENALKSTVLKFSLPGLTYLGAKGLVNGSMSLLGTATNKATKYAQEVGQRADVPLSDYHMFNADVEYLKNELDYKKLGLSQDTFTEIMTRDRAIAHVQDMFADMDEILSNNTTNALTKRTELEALLLKRVPEAATKAEALDWIQAQKIPEFDILHHNLADTLDELDDIITRTSQRELDVIVTAHNNLAETTQEPLNDLYAALRPAEDVDYTFISNATEERLARIDYLREVIKASPDSPDYAKALQSYQDELHKMVNLLGLHPDGAASLAKNQRLALIGQIEQQIALAVQQQDWLEATRLMRLLSRTVDGAVDDFVAVIKRLGNPMASNRLKNIRELFAETNKTRTKADGDIMKFFTKVTDEKLSPTDVPLRINDPEQFQTVINNLRQFAIDHADRTIVQQGRTGSAQYQLSVMAELLDSLERTPSVDNLGFLDYRIRQIANEMSEEVSSGPVYLDALQRHYTEHGTLTSTTFTPASVTIYPYKEYLEEQLNALEDLTDIASSNTINAMNIKGNSVLYNLMYRKRIALKMLLDSEEIQTLATPQMISKLKMASNVLIDLDNGAPFEAMHNSILPTLQGISDYQDMISALLATKEVANAGYTRGQVADIIDNIIDSVHFFGGTDMRWRQSVRSKQALANDILHKVEEQLNAYDMSERADLGSIMTKYQLQDEFDTLARALELPDTTLHSSAGDALRTYLIAKKLGIKFDDDKMLPLVVDIEATGLNRHSDQIMEITIFNARDIKQYKTFTCAPDEGIKPSAEALDKVWGDNTGNLAGAEENYKAFIDKATYKNQQDLLVAVNAYIAELGVVTDTTGRATTLTPYLVGHNLPYDSGMLMRQWQYNNDNAMQYLRDALESTYTQDAIDTLKLVHADMNRIVLTPDTSDAISKVLYAYIDRRAKFFSPVQAMRQTLIQTLSSDTFSELWRVARTLRSDPVAEVREMGDMLTVAYEHFIETLGTIKRANTSLEYMWIAKDEIGSISDDFLHINQLVQAYDKELTGHIAVSMLALQQYFTTDILNAAPEVQLKAQDFARQFARIRDNITIPDELHKISYPQLSAMYVELNQFLRAIEPTKRGLYSMMKPAHADDIRTLYAQVMTMWRRAEFLSQHNDMRNGALATMLANNVVDTRLRELFDNPYMIVGEAAARRRALLQPSVTMNLDDIGELQRVARNLEGTYEEQRKALQQALEHNGMRSIGQQTSATAQLDMLNSATGILQVINYAASQTPTIQRRFLEYLTTLTDTTMLADLVQVSRMDGNTLLRHLWSSRTGVLLVDATDMHPAFVDALRQLQRTAEGTEGLFVENISESVAVIGVDKNYAVRALKDVTFSNKLGYKFSYDKPLEGDLRTIGRCLEDVERSVGLVSDNASMAGHGITLTKEKLQHLYKTLPESVTKRLTPIEDLQKLHAFDGIRFHHSYLGNQFARATYVPFASRNVFKNYLNAITQGMAHADAVTKYKLMWFGDNSMYHVRKWFPTQSTKEIAKELRDVDNVVLAYLIKDESAKMGFRVARMPINEGTINHVLKTANGILIDEPTYINMAKILNDMKMSNTLVRIFAKWVVNPLKATYLGTLGWVMRNFIDSGTKTALTVGGFGEGFKASYQASNIYLWYRKMLFTAKDLSQNTDELIDSRGMRYMLMTLSPEQQELFKTVHAFFQSEAGGGQFQEILSKFHNTSDSVVDRVGEKIGKIMWEYNPLMKHAIVPAQTYIERVNRLAVFLHDIQTGTTINDAMARVLKTHFNFNPTSKARMYLDLVLPFSNFTLSNIEYWAEAMDRSAWVASIMRDILMPIANFDEYSQYELNENRSLQYHILAGNIVNDDNSVMKLGLSIMDAVSSLLDPFDTVASRIVAPLRLPLEIVTAQLQGKPWSDEQISQNLWANAPLIGPYIQRYYGLETNRYGEVIGNGSALKAYKRSGNEWTLILPSIMGATYRLYFFTYNGSDTIYCTTDKDKYAQFLADGALPILDQEDADAALRGQRALKTYARKFRARVYAPKARRRRYYAKKARKPRRAFAKRSYVPRPRRYANANKYGRVFQKHPYAKNFYKKLYTGKGNSRWASRLMPVTPYMLKYRIKMSWSYLR